MKVSGSQIRSHLEDRMSDGDSLLSGKAVVEIEQVSPPKGKFISEIDFEIHSEIQPEIHSEIQPEIQPEIHFEIHFEL